jgi:cysteine desulfuration protein SufE
MTDFQTIHEDLAFLDDWEDRYSYIIDLGNALEGLPDEKRTDDHRVKGCVSQVWLDMSEDDGPASGPVVRIRGDSDAQIVRGLVAVLIAMLDGRPADEVATEDIPGRLKPLGLEQMLSPQRSNGLASMIKTIRAQAAARSAEAA